MVTLDKILIQYSYNLCMIPVIYQTTFLTCTSQEMNTYSSAKFLILQSLTTSSEITLSQLALALIFIRLLIIVITLVGWQARQISKKMIDLFLYAVLSSTFPGYMLYYSNNFFSKVFASIWICTSIYSCLEAS